MPRASELSLLFEVLGEGTEPSAAIGSSCTRPTTLAVPAREGP